VVNTRSSFNQHCCAPCVPNPPQSRRLARVKRFVSWEELSKSGCMHVTRDDVAVLRATVEVHRSTAVASSLLLPPQLPSSGGHAHAVPMSASSVVVPRQHGGQHASWRNATGGDTHDRGNADMAPRQEAAPVPSTAVAPDVRIEEHHKAATAAVSRLAARSGPVAAAVSALTDAVSHGGRPDESSLRGLALAVRQTSTPELALGAFAVVRCLATSSGWLAPGGAATAGSWQCAQSLMATGLIPALVSVLGASPRDAQLQRDGALALGAWALCSLTEGPPGFGGHSVQGADALSLFAAASLARMAIPNASWSQQPVGGRTVAALHNHTGAGFTIPADRLAEVKAILAARKRIAAQLLLKDATPEVVTPPAAPVDARTSTPVAQAAPRTSSASHVARAAGRTPRGSTASTAAGDAA